MKINVKLDMSDDDRDRIATLIDGKQTKRKATGNEIRRLVDAFLMRVCDLDPVRDRPASNDSLADDVIHDINEGGWSFIGQ